MPTLNGVLVRRIDLKLSPKVALNCDNRRLCVFHITKRRGFQSKLGVSSSNQCNLHHSPHTGHLEKKNKKRVQSFSDTVYFISIFSVYFVSSGLLPPGDLIGHSLRLPLSAWLKILSPLIIAPRDHVVESVIVTA